MAEWNCTFTIYVPISAGTEDKAAERMEEVQSMLTLVVPDKRKRPWLGDIEFGEMALEEN